MQLTYNLYKDFKKPVTTQSAKIAYGSYLIGILVYIASLLKIISNNYIILSLICLFIGVIILWTTFFLEEEHSKTFIGYVTFEEEKITFNNVKIFWGEVKELDLTYFDIKGTFNNNSRYQNKRSCGIVNVVHIKLESGESFIGNFLLENKMQSEKLLELLWKVVKSKKLTFENCKRIIHPKLYKDIQELKQILIK